MSADICRHGGAKGLFFPATEAEYEWPDWFRGILYAVAMVYLFLGVSMVADTFVASIEEITSRRTKIMTKSGRIGTKKIWNETVANLSLMALGSSAPEIFLSLIDLFRQGMFASELGTFTIAGSASFNLFVIVAVCIVVIPSTEGRKIKEVPVFYLTAVVSILAYLWMLVILSFISEDEVEIWEAALTLAFLPLLIGVSYWVDVGDFGDHAIFRLLTGDTEEEEEQGETSTTPVSEGKPASLPSTAASAPAIMQHKGPASSRAKAFARGADTRAMGSAGEAPGRRSVNWRRSQTEAKHRLMASITGGSVPLTRSSLRKSGTRLNVGSTGSDGSWVADLNGATGSALSLESRRQSKMSKSAMSSESSQRWSSEDRGKGSKGSTGQRAAASKLGRVQENEPATYVQFMADYQSWSQDCEEKPVVLVRSGDLMFDIKLTYSIRECKAPARSSSDKVHVAAPQGQSASLAPHSDSSASSNSGCRGGPIAGGFRAEETVFAAKDLSVNGQVVVKQGVLGNVVGPSENDPSRIRVSFAHREDGLETHLNVVPEEICSMIGGSGDAAQAPLLQTGELMFELGDMQKEILLPQSLLEALECQSLVLSIDKVENVTEGCSSVAGAGAIHKTQVAAAGAKTAGSITFAQESVRVKKPGDRQFLEIVVLRRGGSSGYVVIDYHTERHTAVPGYHYTDLAGQLEFDEGVTEQTIEVEILPKTGHRVSSEFLVVLEDVEGAVFDEAQDGAPECARILVEIPPVNEKWSCSRCLDAWVNIDLCYAGMCEWSEQFTSAPWVNGSRSEIWEASFADWAFHFVSLPWKLMFALVPGTTLFGGWLCFFSCLLWIALLTGLVADLAELFGCVLGISNEVTAITFVALGTSMPDLFASRAAAMEDETADASVVNVTGSNSVNVFLGLGLPWTIGAIYWAIVGRTVEWEKRNPAMALKLDQMGLHNSAVFVVPANDVAANVLVFVIGCLTALLLLFWRRRLIGIELGGPAVQKVSAAVALVVLWFGYIGIAVYRSSRWNKADEAEKLIVVGCITTVIVLCLKVAMWSTLRYKTSGGKRLAGGPGEDEEGEPPQANGCLSGASAGEESAAAVSAAEEEEDGAPLEEEKSVPETPEAVTPVQAVDVN